MEFLKAQWKGAAAMLGLVLVGVVIYLLVGMTVYVYQRGNEAHAVFEQMLLVIKNQQAVIDKQQGKAQ